MKSCCVCKQVLPKDRFYVKSKAKCGLTSQCKVCYNLRSKNRYDANREEMRAKSFIYREKNRDRLLRKSRKCRGLPDPTRPMPGRCECCGGLPNGKGPKTLGLFLDHCHVTGKFRGWLCSKCNAAIGALGDDLQGVINALTYLTGIGVAK